MSITFEAFKYLSGDEEQIVKPPGRHQLSVGSRSQGLSRDGEREGEDTEEVDRVERGVASILS